MAKFRIDTIADLARQLTFSPHEPRAAQLVAAEELLHLVDSAKAYPLDFVIFKITGYRPRKVEQALLTGIALQHDLGLLIEKISDTLGVQAASVREPVLTIEDVSERFNVTSKTIQRWRRKGLPARRFVFADGKRRVGFLLSSVERFFNLHREQADCGANFTQVTEQESAEIVRRATRMAGCSVAEICRRIGRRLNRSPQAILHVVRKHSGEEIFADAPPELSADERDRISQLHRRGVGLSAIARRMQRPRGEIYRVLLDERVTRLNRKKIKFINDPLYHGEGAEAAVDAIVTQEPIARTPASLEETRIPRDVPPYLQDLYRTPLLTPTRERALFLKFNFHKYQFVTARRKLDPQYAKSRDLARLEGLLRKAIDTKNAIVQANLRLVVSIARKHLRPGLSLMELVSEGNVTLMRAVEGFDIHRGNRFSTYATLALMKGFARSVPALVGASRSDSQRLPEVPDSRLARLGERIVHRDEVRQLLSRLDERERTVLLAHYGLGEEHVAATYEQVGERLGLSKQRVRQIEQGALAKLRNTP